MSVYRSTPRVKWVTVLLVVAIGSMAWTYRDSLLRSVAGHLVDSRRSDLQQHVGHNLPKDFVVASADGASLRAVSLAVRSPALLVFFSDKCPPCRAALNQIRLRQGGQNGTPWPEIYFLLGDDGIAPPVGVPADHVLYVESSGSTDWLRPNVTPVFYRIDAEGRVSAILVGYDDQELAAQLDDLLSPPASGMRVEN